MGRIAGKTGRLYAAITSGGQAEPITFMTQWDMNFATEKNDVTAFGDVNKMYVSGFADATGSFAGFYDDATPQMYTAAVDGVPRRFYFYPDVTTTTKYWHGQAIFDFAVSQQVSGGVAISGSWAATSEVKRV